MPRHRFLSFHAIVLVAVKGLIDVSAFAHLRRVSRFEFTIAMVALFAVLLLGILKGVLVAVIVSIIVWLASAARPSQTKASSAGEGSKNAKRIIPMAQ